MIALFAWAWQSLNLRRHTLKKRKFTGSTRLFSRKSFEKKSLTGHEGLDIRFSIRKCWSTSWGKPLIWRIKIGPFRCGTISIQ